MMRELLWWGFQSHESETEFRAPVSLTEANQATPVPGVDSQRASLSTSDCFFAHTLLYFSNLQSFHMT